MHSPKITACVGSPRSEPDNALRELISTVLAECGLSRPQIATALSEKIGRTITVSQLNDYTARTKRTARFPAAYVPAFCTVTGDYRIARYLLAPEDRGLLDLGVEIFKAEQTKAGIMAEILAAEGYKRGSR